MYPAWLTAELPEPASIEAHLQAALDLTPAAVIEETELADELKMCKDLSYFHFWLNALQDIGVYLEDEGRDDELPVEFWTRLATAAHAMTYPQMVPFLLGKAHRRPRKDVPDLMAAFATLPAVLGDDLRGFDAGLADACSRAATVLRDAGPPTAALVDAAELAPLAAHLGGTEVLQNAGEELAGLFTESFDLLFELAAHPDFPAEHAEHAWAVISTNVFRVVLDDGPFITTHAEVWWRAGEDEEDEDG